MILPTALLKRLAIFLHRWMGVAFSLLFLLWFVSGIVMMYWSFPGVSPLDRLERSPVLNADAVTVSPDEAFKMLRRRDPPSAVRLQSFDGRPAYRFQFSSGEETVYADDGNRQVGIPLQMTRRIAAAWAGPQAGTATGEGDLKITEGCH